VGPGEEEARGARARQGLEHGLHGEEEDASTPQRDLAAAVAIAVFALVVMGLALGLPNPGSVLTAPGLLPFLTGLSLFAMAVGLGVAALRAGGGKGLGGIFAAAASSDAHPGRAWALVGLLAAMIVVIDAVPFELRFRAAGRTLEIGTFECVSIPFLAFVLRIFWRASVLRCLLVAGVTVVGFAAAFRYGFNIPLPGSG
jgi:hypothetical protein